MEVKTVNRRGLLKGLSAITVGVASSAAIGQALCQTPTAQQTEGPFYPVQDQSDKDADLINLEGRELEALGEKIIVKGVVADQTCRPVEGAVVEIWQACHSGRYKHPQDPNTNADLDPNFQYWGIATTDAEGNYEFKTIRPGNYPATSEWVRPSHIHFKIAKRGYEELTTQLYFAGDEFNAGDRILNSLSTEDQNDVIVDFEPGENGEFGVGTFDLVLNRL